MLPLDEPGYSGAYQQVADTGGIVFVRYGKGQTVDAQVRKLGGMLTQVSVLSDQGIIHRGKKARRVTVALETGERRAYFHDDAEKGAFHKTLPAERQIISVMGFRHRGTPVLAGYRIPDLHLKTYESILEHVVNSVSSGVPVDRQPGKSAGSKQRK